MQQKKAVSDIQNVALRHHEGLKSYNRRYKKKKLQIQCKVKDAGLQGVLLVGMTGIIVNLVLIFSHRLSNQEDF